ncbi:MAG: hypothetical protein LUG55_01985 [Clostridiales bacterium]|nr:hypothetical protein [Clostridiales bacterium]
MDTSYAIIITYFLNIERHRANFLSQNQADGKNQDCRKAVPEKLTAGSNRSLFGKNIYQLFVLKAHRAVAGAGFRSGRRLTAKNQGGYFAL